MKTEIKKNNQLFNIGPFIEDRLICGINALIDVLDLPHEKLKRVDREEVAALLSSLSQTDSTKYVSLISQSVKFQVLLEVLCADNEELIERVFNVCEEKFQHFLTTGNYI